MAVLWPFLLATLAYATYQVALKYARPDVNILLLLAFAYFVSCVSALALWAGTSGIGEQRLLPRDLLVAADDWIEVQAVLVRQTPLPFLFVEHQLGDIEADQVGHEFQGDIDLEVVGVQILTENSIFPNAVYEIELFWIGNQ